VLFEVQFAMSDAVVFTSNVEGEKAKLHDIGSGVTLIMMGVETPIPPPVLSAARASIE
jgi:hypothetical protein